jgi:type IV secretory pathway VirB3-like protein
MLPVEYFVTAAFAFTFLLVLTKSLWLFLIAAILYPFLIYHASRDQKFLKVWFKSNQIRPRVKTKAVHGVIRYVS